MFSYCSHLLIFRKKWMKFSPILFSSFWKLTSITAAKVIIWFFSLRFLQQNFIHKFFKFRLRHVIFWFLAFYCVSQVMRSSSSLLCLMELRIWSAICNPSRSYNRRRNLEWITWLELTWLWDDQLNWAVHWKSVIWKQTIWLHFGNCKQVAIIFFNFIWDF